MVRGAHRATAHRQERKELERRQRTGKALTNRKEKRRVVQEGDQEQWRAMEERFGHDEASVLSVSQRGLELGGGENGREGERRGEREGDGEEVKFTW